MALAGLVELFAGAIRLAAGAALLLAGTAFFGLDAAFFAFFSLSLDLDFSAMGTVTNREEWEKIQ
jgi:hypothetical protein